MPSRLDLDNALRSICEHVYFQPPANIRMEYPCIVYNCARGRDYWADNAIYEPIACYEITVIDKDPDSKLAETIHNSFSYCSFDRVFRSDNLNHFTFTIYYRYLI